jgi:hypothetical protein
MGIEADAAGIDIPASSFSGRYRSILVPDWDTLTVIWYRTVRHSTFDKITQRYEY